MLKYLEKNKVNDEIVESEKLKSNQLVQLFEPNAHEISKISDEIGADVNLLRDILDMDEMPRFEMDDDKSFIFTRFSYKDGANRTSTSPILFVINDKLLAVISPKKIDRIELTLFEEKKSGVMKTMKIS